MDTYDSKTIQDCSYEELITKISHLAHDLDKTINTLPGLPEFNQTANNEIKNLTVILEEWKRREPDKNDTVDWAQGLIMETNNLLLNINHKELKKDISNIDIDYSKAKGLLKLIKKRRSIRSWLKIQIPREAIDMLLEAATWAPSACNRQSVRYIVLQDEKQRMALVKLREKFLDRAPTLIFIGADKRNYYPEEVEIVPYLDASVAVQNLLLMAHAMDLGAVMVKCTNVDINMDSDWSGGIARRKAISDMYSKLKLPPYFLPVAIIALGFPARFPKEPPRLSPDKVRYFERFENKEEPQSYGKRKNFEISSWKWQLVKLIRKIARRFGIRIYVTIC